MLVEIGCKTNETSSFWVRRFYVFYGYAIISAKYA